MRELKVYVEINGDKVLVGYIRGEDWRDAGFRYDSSYLSRENTRGISISLPLREEPFSSEQTKNYFEGLLPEGFSRRTVANWLKADEDDYITILSGLGKECLGAVRILEDGDDEEGGYELLPDERVKELAAEGATASTEILVETHLSLAGATGKVGLYYDAPENKWYLPKGDAPSTHIVKQSHIRLKQIVLNEQLCIRTAGNMGISVPESFIINPGSGADDDLLYATARYDRVLSDEWMVDGLKRPYRLHQEDFAQALGIAAADKYEKNPSGYMSGMFELLRNYSSAPMADQLELLRIIVFDHLIGNTDCHVKNFSLLYDKDMRSLRLAPAYDLLATRIYNTTSDMSFFIGGELNIDRIGRDSFARAASEIGLSEKMVLATFDEMANSFEKALNAAAEEMAENGFEETIGLKQRIMNTISV